MSVLMSYCFQGKQVERQLNQGVTMRFGNNNAQTDFDKTMNY